MAPERQIFMTLVLLQLGTKFDYNRKWNDVHRASDGTQNASVALFNL